MKKILILLLFASFLIAIYSIRNLSSTYLEKPVSIEIKKGETLKEISKKLQQKHIVKNWKVFYIYSLIKGSNLKYGFYEFKGNVSIKKVWETLYEGKEKLITITIIPGSDLLDIADILNKAGLVDKKEFLDFVFDKTNVEKFGLKGTSFEGYFPPETYYFRKNETLQNIIMVFLNQFKKKYKNYETLAKKKGLDFYKVMIIASLIEKETFIEEEKPIIAGVIYNRLKRRMHLQIDPTVIYALKLEGKWNGNLTRENMKINSKYNTYINYGLPPTPICNFSISSLKSAIDFKDTQYLYYVFDGKRHIFSKTYTEHINNIKKILNLMKTQKNK